MESVRAGPLNLTRTLSRFMYIFNDFYLWLLLIFNDYFIIRVELNDVKHFKYNAHRWLYFQKQPSEVSCAKETFYESCRPQPYNFILKETSTQVFSREFCKIFKNIYFKEHLQTTASVLWRFSAYCNNWFPVLAALTENGLNYLTF